MRRTRIGATPASIHLTTRTVFTAGGKAATSTAVLVGSHIRVHGYYRLNDDQRTIPRLTATAVSTIVPQTL